jgi:DNA-binding CsgD family transcriptional regulator
MDQEKGLTRRQLQCLDRRHHHYTHKEIARELGVSPATVAMHLRLARAKLRSRQRKQASETVDREREELERRGDQQGPAYRHSSCSDLLTKAAALLMAWLTILALLVLLTKPLIERAQQQQDIADPLESAGEAKRSSAFDF